jgi:hypothetical protein
MRLSSVVVVVVFLFSSAVFAQHSSGGGGGSSGGSSGGGSHGSSGGLLRVRVRLMPPRPAARAILPAAIHRPLLVLRAAILPLVTLAQLRVDPRLPRRDRARTPHHTLPPRRLRSPRREVFSPSFAILSTGRSRNQPSRTSRSRYARARIARSLRPSHQSLHRR